MKRNFVIYAGQLLLLW